MLATAGDDNQCQEWVFNLIMITNKVSVKIGEAMEKDNSTMRDKKINGDCDGHW